MVKIEVDVGNSGLPLYVAYIICDEKRILRADTTYIVACSKVECLSTTTNVRKHIALREADL